ncbi:MAG: leucine-rich repeat protein [Ruminococcus sp.]|nr:leucine-rich repeat protein [Ruminococcus sp.]
MKTFIKTLSAIFSILIIISVLTPALNVNAEENVYSGTTGDCSWEYDPDTKTITISGEGDMDNYFGSVETPWYSYKDEIENVRFEGEIYSIGEWTFAGFKSIKNIEFCDSIETIKDHAFSGCDSLEEVKFNSGLRVIDDNAFDYCSNLKKIDLPDSLVAVYTFNYCDSLTEVELPINVSYVAWSFKNCKSLKKVYLHHNLKHITKNCFIDCDNLTDVFYYGTEKEWKNIQFDIDVIKSLNLHYLEDITHANGCIWRFDDTTSTLTISGNNRVLEYVNENDIPWITYKNNTKNVVFSEGIQYIGKCLRGFTSIENIELPDSLKGIGIDAFGSPTPYSNLLISELTIPENVTRIKNYAFTSCINLRKVIIKSELKSIPDQAFLECSSLKVVSIPKSVKEIGYNTFCDCDSLSDIYYEGTEEEWNKISVNEKGNDALKSATIHYGERVPNTLIIGTTGGCEWKFYKKTNTLYIYGQNQMAYYKKDDLPPWYDFKDDIKKVVFEKGVQHVGGFSFYNCTNLKEVIFSDTIEIIGESAFQNCSSIEKLEFGKLINYIWDFAFSGCNSLKNVKLPDHLRFFSNAFYGCTALEEVTIPESLGSLPRGSFSNCPALKTVRLTKYTSDLNYSFRNCPNIKDVYYKGTEEDWKNKVVNNDNLSNAEIHYLGYTPPDEYITWSFDESTATLTFSGKGVLADCHIPGAFWYDYHEKVKHIVIENGITHIKESEFIDFENLETIKFPETLEYIGDSAFANCIKLRNVIFPNNLNCVMCHAFAMCYSIENVYIPRTVTAFHVVAFDHINNIYYEGTEKEWNNITLGESPGEKKPEISYDNIYFNYSALQNHYETKPIETTLPPTTAEPITEPVETTLPPTTAGPITEPIVTTVPPTTAEPITEPVETTIPPTTAEPITEPVETTLPPTTAEPTTEPIVTTVPPTTAEFTTEPIVTTVPPTTAGPIAEPIVITVPPTTAGPVTEPVETTLPPTTAEPTTEPIETTEPVTQLESTLTPVITPITIPSVVTEPTESPIVKVKKVPQRISAKSYNKQNGDKPFKIKAKAKGKLSFSTKTKAVKLDKDGNVIIKTAGVAVIKISAASTSKYKAAVKSIKIVIRPKIVKLTRAKGTEKKYTIHFKKQKGVSGYELRYKPVGSKKWKTVTASKSASYFTIKNLKYVKHIIRASAYIKDGKKKLYGKYNQKFFAPN